jgi:hypothetical protein
MIFIPSFTTIRHLIQKLLVGTHTHTHGHGVINFPFLSNKVSRLNKNKINEIAVECSLLGIDTDTDSFINCQFNYTWLGV